MKKLFFVSVLFVLLFVVTPVYAGSVDGLWALYDSDQVLNSFAMLRENSGLLLMTSLVIEMDDWEAFYGPFDGTTSHLTPLVTRWSLIDLNCTFLSPASASCTITSCTPTVSSSCDEVSIGEIYTLQKWF